MLEIGTDFYESQNTGLGAYFNDCLAAEDRIIKMLCCILLLKEQDNPYEDVALIYCVFLCNRCSNELLDHPHRKDDPGSGWENAFGEYAKQQGWLAQWQPGENDWLVLCPTCVRSHGGAT